MKNHTVFLFIMFGVVITLCSQLTIAEHHQADLAEAMKGTPNNPLSI